MTDQDVGEDAVQKLSLSDDDSDGDATADGLESPIDEKRGLIPSLAGALGKEFFIHFPDKERLDLMKLEALRYQTFNDWPSETPVSIMDVVTAGFYHTGPGDRVRCAFCLNILKNWDEGDDPMKEHASFFEDCPFVKDRTGCGNVTSAENSAPPDYVEDLARLSEIHRGSHLAYSQPLHRPYYGLSE